MKNKLIAIFTLCIATFACAQSVPTIGKYAPREHRGFYNSTSFGTAYNWFYNSLDDTDKYNDRQRHDVEYYEFSGGSFALGEFKFGVAIADLVAFHTVFNVGFFMGTVDYFNERYHERCTEVGCINVPEIENVDILPSKKRNALFIHCFDRLLKDNKAICYIVNLSDFSGTEKLWNVIDQNDAFSSNNLRLVSINRFYAIVFDVIDAYQKICNSLPTILEDIN